ncbi:MAG: hypothetical protein IPM52_07290 [Bacteroidetes bacterium]|nr:hypothetical protein [Bacteroidota bacterium]
MMIYLLSHNDLKIKSEINQIIGRPYTFRERWLMGGNGSGGQVVTEADEKLLACLPDDGSIRKCNIELREKGILVGFHRGLETFGWVVPYYMLTIYGHSNSLTLYAGPHRLSLRWPAHIRSNQKFLDKLMKLRAESLAANEMP